MVMTFSPATPAALSELLEQVKDKIESTRRNDQFISIKPKPMLSSAETRTLHDKMVNLGAEYDTTNETYILPLQEGRKAEQLANILLRDLVPGPNPRLTLTVTDLLKDVMDNGLHERIKARPSKQVEGKYEVIDGNRRKKVAELLKWRDIPAVIKDMTDQEAYETAFTVNNNRNGFTDAERGRWFEFLMDKFPDVYPTQTALAEHLGLSQVRVSQLIAGYEFKERERKKSNIKTRVLMDDSEPSHEEAKPSAEDNTTPPPKPELSERIIREIRIAPPEIRDALEKEAREKKLTAFQVKQRADEMKWDYQLSHAPESVRSSFSQAKFEYPKKIKQLYLLLTGKTLVMPKLVAEEDRAKAFDAALTRLRAQAAKEYKKEAVKEKAFKKTLSEYFELDFRDGIAIVVDRFKRQDKETTARLAYKLAAKAVKALTPDQLKTILDEINEEMKLTT